MESFKECSIWKKTEIIDLPFLPFEGDKQVTSKMINESAKYIKKVKNVNFREANPEINLKNQRKFFFYQADTLVGLDISLIDVSSKTYLDQFFFLLKMYPMVMINSYMPEESMKEIALHSYCLEHNYILPVFGPMPFWDKALSGSYYSEDIAKIFKGELEKIKIKDFVTVSDKITDEELKIRFPQFMIENEEISFHPQVTWLGVADKHIENLLDYLFNNNIEVFDLNVVCKDFSIEESKLTLYIDRSMLFYGKDRSKVIFRLQRKNIYWGFICNLAAQFEKEMIDRDAICYDLKIDESIGTIKAIDEKIYHKLGNLFNKYDSFSYKMFSNIKRLLDSREYSNILIVNNGNMKGIISMLQGIGMQDNLYEVLDYYSVAVKYPNVDYSKLKDQSVLVITDVINTGKLIKSTLDFLNNLNCNKIGIYSYIIGQDFEIKSIISDEKINISYLTEKELNKIDEILDEEYTSRFEMDRDVNFRLLWGDVGKDIRLKEVTDPYFNDISNEKHYRSYYSYEFDLQGDINSNSYIYQKIKRLLTDIDLVLIYKQYSNYHKIVDKIIKNEMDNSNIKVFEIEEPNINLLKVTEEFENGQALFIIPIKLTKNRNMRKFIDINRIANSKFLDIIECEIYSLDSDKVIDENDIEKRCIFQTKLRRYRASFDNPRLEELK